MICSVIHDKKESSFVHIGNLMYSIKSLVSYSSNSMITWFQQETESLWSTGPEESRPTQERFQIELQKDSAKKKKKLS